MVQYPSHMLIARGGRPAPSVDLLGRVSTRANQAKQDRGIQGPSAGGTPNWNGPQGMLPFLLRAAQERGLTPDAVDQDLLARIDAMGAVPQQLAKTLRTADPMEQARLLLGGRS